MATMVTCHAVKKSYSLGKTRVNALRGVDLQIEEGEFLVIAGPSGSGKTTLLNICGLIDSLDSGELSFTDQILTKASEKKLVIIRKEKIGFIFQNFNLIPVLTAHENVEFPLLLLKMSAKKREDLVRRYLTKVGLWERRNHRPTQLSGGEQQRVAVARALVKQPCLVIADEPSGNLDSHNTHQVIETMRRLNEEENITFIIASHDPIVLKTGKRLIRMKDGKLDGTYKKGV